MKSSLCLLFLFLSFSIFAQTWTQALRWGGSGNETCHGLAVASDGSIFLAGTFQNNLVLDSQTLQTRGESDIFLFKTNAQGDISWAKRAGGLLADEVTAITLDKNDHLICAGSFRLEADFDNLMLNATQNPKAIFIAKYDTNGQLTWGKSLSGGGLKDADAIACDQEGNIFLTGHFQDSLTVVDTTLYASGRTDFFLAKLSPDGNLIWALRQGQSGDTRATALGLTSDGDPIVAGYFNDTTRIADTVLTANTSDQDMFLTRVSKNGQPIWAKKAGGVFDKDVTSMVLDDMDNVYLTGYLVGVMRLSDDLVIQSSTGNPDFFLLKYKSNGTPLNARALGGTMTQQTADMILQNGNLILTGFYSGNMSFDGFSFSAGAALNSFVAAFDSNLTCQWAKDIVSNSSAFAMEIAADPNENIWVGGSFLGQVRFDEINLESSSFDLFLAKANPNVTSTSDLASKSQIFQVFPNPASDFVLIQTEEADYYLELLNSKGQIIWSGRNATAIQLEQFPEGIYLVKFQTNVQTQSQKIVIQKRK